MLGNGNIGSYEKSKRWGVGPQLLRLQANREKHRIRLNHSRTEQAWNWLIEKYRQQTVFAFAVWGDTLTLWLPINSEASYIALLVFCILLRAL
jgi:hypothetical protein